jgi:alpha-L-arabinofuranosidase
MTIDSQSKRVSYIGMFWALGHFSRFVRRGARRIESHGHQKPLAAVRSLLVLLLLAMGSRAQQPLQNGGFEDASPTQSWQIETSDSERNFSVSLDKTDFKQGRQSLVISSEGGAHVALQQTIFLPMGTLWQVDGWVKSSLSGSPTSSHAPGIRLESASGDQGFSTLQPPSREWQKLGGLFRVPSPGRLTVALNAFEGQSGKVWFDGIQLGRVDESLKTEPVTISSQRLSKRPIDLKQGGQFIEFLCNLIPSMIAQQVDSTSFEEEPPWNQSFNQAIDKPHRPWYPDGSVHVAKYSFDTDNAFNGKRSQKIELPIANTWAGLSQDGFYLQARHSYRLRLHLRSDASVHVRASLHGSGGLIAGPVSLGPLTREWKPAEVLLTATRDAHNATLTIEFEGPGTLWLDRVYLIDSQAVLGIWRPDVVNALKAMKPGIVRLGGTTIESLEWEKTVGTWDSRVPFEDPPWGGLQENFVGVEEFARLVQRIGAEPLICVRWTGKTPQDAAHEVEYFNGSADTEWGMLRAKNGHPAPYHVKYWQIGNEVGGPEYDASLKAFAEAMRQVDPSIKILSSFPSPDTLRLADGEIDYLSPHHYSIGDLSGTEESLKELGGEIAHSAHGKQVGVAITEWNTTGGEFGLTRAMLMTLANALNVSRYQSLLHRYSDLVEIANRSNLTDSFGSGAIQTGSGWMYFTPAYYSQRLYQRAAGSFPLKILRNNSLPFYLQEPDLDATLSQDGKTLRIYAVNSTPNRRRIRFRLDSQLGETDAGKVFVLTDGNATPDSEAMNSRDDPTRIHMLIRTAQIKGSQFSYEFAPFSVTLNEIELTKR